MTKKVAVRAPPAGGPRSSPWGPAMIPNPEAGTATNLSADRPDGKDSGAEDADTLDGVDPAAFGES